MSKREIDERRVDFVELEELAEVIGNALDWFAARGRPSDAVENQVVRDADRAPQLTPVPRTC